MNIKIAFSLFFIMKSLEIVKNLFILWVKYLRLGIKYL